MPRESIHLPTRRDLLRRAFFATAAGFADMETLFAERQGVTQIANGFAGGRFLGLVPFAGEARVSLGQSFGDELDGRLYTDLSSVKTEKPVTATEDFYVRTRVSKLLDFSRPWSVRVGGNLLQPLSLSREDLRQFTKPMGRHLMECAGNVRSVHFGMVSVADWAGVPLSEILERARRTPDASRVVVSGFDTYSAPSASSVPGASWSFTEQELQTSGAFLATEMNGNPLAKDHGAPVRLVVPGWYGCTCIKWVNEISFVAANAEATSQMQEYAARTMQTGVPKLARDYKPAVIEQAAMPIRIEKWIVDNRIRYRVAGILWGGSALVKKLQIRFNPDEEYVDVQELDHKHNDPWSFWNHLWEPKKPGTYMIRLSVAQPRVVARRLDAGFYMRSVNISEV